MLRARAMSYDGRHALCLKSQRQGRFSGDPPKTISLPLTATVMAPTGQLAEVLPGPSLLKKS